MDFDGHRCVSSFTMPPAVRGDSEKSRSMEKYMQRMGGSLSAYYFAVTFGGAARQYEQS
jgi:hypothetical protein